MKAYLFIIITILSLLLFSNFLVNYQNKNKKDDKEKQETNKTDESSMIIATDTIFETDKIIETDIITNKEEENKDDFGQHYFTALYKTKKGKKTKAFNTYGISVNDSKYFISYLPDIDSERRQLEENNNIEINLTDVANGYFNSPEDGIVR